MVANIAVAADAYTVTAFTGGPFDTGVPTDLNRNGQMLVRTVSLDWFVADENGVRSVDASGLVENVRISGPNAAGWLAGSAGATGSEAAYLWNSAGVRSELGLLPGGVQFNMARDLNETLVVGVGDANGKAVAWSRALTGGDYRLLPGTTDNGQSQAEGVGSAGHVVGLSFSDDFSTILTTVWAPDGTATSFSPRDGRVAYSRLINGSGQATGYFFSSYDSFWVWSDGVLQEVFAPDAGDLYSVGISDAGLIAGNWFGPASADGGAFVWSKSGGFKTLNSLVAGSGWNVINAFEVSSDGRIAAEGYHNDFGFAFLRLDPIATAIPEPATWAMMIAGFGIVGGALRRRKFAVA